MKKMNKLMAVAATAALCVGGVVGFAACGSPAPEVTNTYTVGVKEENSYGGSNFISYTLTLYSNSTYEMTKTELTFAYSMILGTTTTIVTGACTVGAEEDGYTAVSLAQADDITYMSFSKMGGYDFTYTLANFAEEGATVEFPNKVTTNKTTFLALGAATTVYVQAEKSALSLTNPNA